MHGHTPAQRVCTEGFDIGRRFLSCLIEVSAKFIILLQLMPPLILNTIYHWQGYEPCAFVNWLDEEWHGMARSVITKLAEDNVKLKKKLVDLECTISTMKQERINHMQQVKARDKKELACVVLVVALAMF